MIQKKAAIYEQNDQKRIHAQCKSEVRERKETYETRGGCSRNQAAEQHCTETPRECPRLVAEKPRNAAK